MNLLLYCITISKPLSPNNARVFFTLLYTLKVNVKRVWKLKRNHIPFHVTATINGHVCESVFVEESQKRLDDGQHDASDNRQNHKVDVVTVLRLQHAEDTTQSLKNGDEKRSKAVLLIEKKKKRKRSMRMRNYTFLVFFFFWKKD